MPDDPLARLRRICLAQPDSSERLSHGEPTWFYRGRKVCVTFADHHHDDRLALLVCGSAACAGGPGRR